jgi:hypothetical protein
MDNITFLVRGTSYRHGASTSILLFCSLDSIQGSTCTGLKDVCQTDSLRFSTVYHSNSNSNLLKAGSYQGADNDDDMCQIDDKDDFLVDSSVKSKSLLAADDIKVPNLFVILPLFYD